MAERLNVSARDAALDAIARDLEDADLGLVDRSNAWTWSDGADDDLLGDPADWSRYSSAHLGIDDDAADEDRARYRYAFATVTGDDAVVVSRDALAQIADESTNAPREIRDAAAELVRAIDGETEEETEGSEAANPAEATTGGGSGGGGGKPRPVGDPPIYSEAAAEPGQTRELATADPIRFGRAADGPQRTATLFREAPIDRASIDEDRRTVRLSVSSEFPVERFFGVEILDHSPESVILPRLETSGQLLLDHEGPKVIGVVERAWLEGKRLWVEVRFSRNAAASDVWRDVVDGIRRSVSIGYAVGGMMLEEERDGIPTYRISPWEPLEVSFVGVPADWTVGPGRSREALDELLARARRDFDVGGLPPDPGEGITMNEKNAPAADPAALERARAREIRELGEINGCPELARKHVDDGSSVEDFCRAFMREKKSETIKLDATPDSAIGMSAADLKRYSVLKIARHLDDPSSRALREAAAFELECSEAYSQHTGRTSERGGIFLPTDVVRGERALTATTTNAAAELVNVMHSPELIPFLRAKSVLLNRARVMVDLDGPFSMTRQTATAVGEWTASDGASLATAIDQFRSDLFTLNPRSVGALANLTRKLLVSSSPDAEMIVREDLFGSLGTTFEKNAIQANGTAGLMTGPPVGILNAAGVGTVASSTLTYHEIALELEADVANANGDVGDLLYITSPRVRKRMKNEPMFTGAGTPTWHQNEVNGYAAFATTNSPDDLTASNFSALSFGDASQAMFAIFGGLELVPEREAISGMLKLALWAEADFGLRRPETWSVCQDIDPT